MVPTGGDSTRAKFDLLLLQLASAPMSVEEKLAKLLRFLADEIDAINSAANPNRIMYSDDAKPFTGSGPEEL